MDHPRALFKKEFCQAPPVAFGHGVLVKCTRYSSRASPPKYAIPNPDLAPFGISAMKYLEDQGQQVGRDIELVYVENVAQVNAVLTSGAVDGGFTSMTYAIHRSDSMLHCIDLSGEIEEPIEMGMITLEVNSAFPQFQAFMLSPVAQGILSRNGIIPSPGN